MTPTSPVSWLTTIDLQVRKRAKSGDASPARSSRRTSALRMAESS